VSEMLIRGFAIVGALFVVALLSVVIGGRLR
jgi:hypothetical protein